MADSWMLLILALLLGVRHATDPDHLTAISTLFLGNEKRGAGRAALLGLSWGLGHATTIVSFGLPVVWYGQYLPEAVQRGAEAVVGLVIVLLALRLLIRWRRGYFHVHVHTHGNLQHAHLHAHENEHAINAALQHRHRHAGELGRSPLAAFGIGLVHGAGGSAAVGVLFIGSAGGAVAGAAALLIFALATAGTMALISMLFGLALTRRAVNRRLTALVPVLGVASLMFGVWYSLAVLRLGR